jgi:putative hydrolase of the HAD superfamily
LDDTLYPEKQFVMSGFSAVAGYLHRRYKLDEKRIITILHSDFNQGLRKKNLNVLVEKLKIHEDIIQSIIQIYREHEPNISLYPDAKIILDELKDKKKLGLITDGIPKTQRNKINALNLSNFFNEIIINDISKTNKLNPLCYTQMIKSLESSPNHCLYVGDNPLKDFYTPKQLGIKTIQINRIMGEYAKASIDEKLKADMIIDSLTELTHILKLR